MKANELMIGDWVFTKDYPIKALPQKVIPEYFVRSLVEFEPIHLTPEILEKNGFERSKVFVEWKYENDNVYIIYKPFPYLKIQMEECIVAFPCEYIHQLQHALRLCGIEKEIEL